MRLKSLELTANIAWSPATQYPVYLATGTAAHQLDDTFSTVSSINVFRLELGDRSSTMPLVGSVTSNERFNQVVWGGYGMGSGGSSEAGVIVTAGDHGKVSVWNASKLMTNGSGDEDQSSALIVQTNDHVGAVNALDFNTFQPNLLASGGADSEILIWDLEKMDAPMTPGSKSQPAEDVLSLAWNKKVQHILASTFSNRCVVWDLKKNEPIIKVSDGMSRMKCKLVSWHPGIATQLCLSSEDDHTPVIQLWDLRFATSPVQSMEQHTKGVLAMSWCPRDPNLLLSCGKDNQMICWNPNAAQTGGEIVYQAQLPSQWVFDLAWCPRNPALVAASSFDGHVSLYSLMGGTSRPERTPQRVSESFGDSDDPFQKITQPPTSTAASEHMGCLRRAPSWMRRPCGARFAFGGKLITWSSGGTESETPTSEPQPTNQGRSVYLSQVVTELETISRANALDSVVQENKFVEFCTMKAANSSETIENEIWEFLKISFSSNSRSEYKEYLGFSKDEDLVAETLKQLKMDDGDDEKDDEGDEKQDDMLGADAFDTLAASASRASMLTEPLENQLHLDPHGEDKSVEKALALALLTGRLEEAVNLCLHNGRHGEALILAVSGGAELYQRAQQRVLRRIVESEGGRTASVARLIRAVVARDWEGVVSLCSGANWRAGLACVLTYASGEELGSLCERIGANLEGSGDKEAALRACLCYICAGNADRLVRCWMRYASVESPLSLQDLIDKVVVLEHSLRAGGSAPAEPGPAAAAQLGRYATLLASQGLLDVALRYLGDQREESLLLLRDRIYRGVLQPPAGVPTPPNLFSQPGPTQATASGAGGGAAASRTSRLTGRPHQVMHPASQPGGVHNVGGVGGGYSMARNPGYPGGSGVGITSQPSGYPQPNIYTPAPISSPSMPPPAPIQPGDPSMATPPPPITKTSPSMVGGRLPNRHAAGGWNDPPVLRERTKTTESETVAPTPINNFYNPAAYMPDPNAGPPQANAMRYPPGPGMAGPMPSPSYNTYVPNGAVGAPGGNFYSPNAVPPGGPSVPGGITSGSRSAPQPTHQRQPPQQPPQMVSSEPKPPLPQEHQALEQVLGQLLNLCKSGATSRQMKMKMDDVDRKLEALYDSIRSDMVSQSVLAGVHNVVAAVRVGDYNHAIAIINHIVETANFAEIRAFVPGLKVLMQSASMMQIRVT